VIEFDKDFFRGKKILVFDDILTKGFSYARFACQLEKIGGEVLGGFFLGKTVVRML
jgi:orotate phosphoribosyltransferase